MTGLVIREYIRYRTFDHAFRLHNIFDKFFNFHSSVVNTVAGSLIIVMHNTMNGYLLILTCIHYLRFKLPRTSTSTWEACRLTLGFGLVLCDLDLDLFCTSLPPITELKV